jgi:hypothetical protein
MITLEKIISSNLEMLENQAKELLKSLDFVQKAKKLFQTQNGNVATKKTRRRRSVAKAVSRKPKAIQTNEVKGKDTHISRVKAVLQQKNGQTSGNIIQTLFDQQQKNKNKQHFAQTIYNAINQAKKKNLLNSKDGKIYLK